jgi:hypothetical protein
MRLLLIFACVGAGWLSDNYRYITKLVQGAWVELTYFNSNQVHLRGLIERKVPYGDCVLISFPQVIVPQEWESPFSVCPT